MHLHEKPGFLRIANAKNLNCSLRNPVFLVLLTMVQDISYPNLIGVGTVEGNVQKGLLLRIDGNG
jgi:hypothetical protein